MAAVADALAQRGISDSMRRLGYPPHVTIAVCEERTDREALLDTVRQIAADWCRLPLHCPALGVFPGTPATLFAAPTVTEDLLELHADLLRRLPAQQVHPHYRSGSWFPHITLADDLPAAHVADAMASALEVFQPVAAELVRVDVVHFRPVTVLWHANLQNHETAG